MQLHVSLHLRIYSLFGIHIYIGFDVGFEEFFCIHWLIIIFIGDRENGHASSR